MKNHLVRPGHSAACGMHCGQGLGRAFEPQFRVTASVVSSGGGPAASAVHSISATLGQPTPLMDYEPPPMSVSFDLLPGFWHVVAKRGCACDIVPDGDVDGFDLSEHIFDNQGIGLDIFADEFGKQSGW